MSSEMCDLEAQQPVGSWLDLTKAALPFAKSGNPRFEPRDDRVLWLSFCISLVCRIAGVKLLMNTQGCIKGAEVAMLKYKQNSEQTDPSTSILVSSDS